MPQASQLLTPRIYLDWGAEFQRRKASGATAQEKDFQQPVFSDLYQSDNQTFGLGARWYRQSVFHTY